MAHDVYSRSAFLAATPDEVYEWHSRPGAVERLLPPWEAIRVVGRTPGIAEGHRSMLEIGLGPVWADWVTELRDVRPGRGFTDVQVRGPFARWKHVHSFHPAEGDGCLLEDRVEYLLPGGQAARIAAGGKIRSRLDRCFAYRHRVLARDLDLHSRYRLEGSRHVLITGSTGLLGSALAAALASGGHRVTRLSRGTGSGPEARATDGAVLHWDPAQGIIDELGEYDFVVHLAGESIGRGRWTEKRKRAIRDSRTHGTRLLCDALVSASHRPEALVCASAVGVYGDRGEAEVDEDSGPGEGFLAGVCQAWEEEASSAGSAGIRVALLRLGMVLTPAGGALAPMLLPFRLGLGGRLGRGDQYMSWISLDDFIGCVLHVLATPELSGPVNAVAPHSVRNDDFTRILGGILGRPTPLPLPAAVLELLFGEMGRALLLEGARVVPSRLAESGYVYRDPELAAALSHLLGRAERESGS